jgi:hypothetical protein
MTTSKQIWGAKPEGNQTSLRFCCPHCSEWVRNTEFEAHIKLAHPEILAPQLKPSRPAIH